MITLPKLSHPVDCFICRDTGQYWERVRYNGDANDYEIQPCPFCVGDDEERDSDDQLSI